MYKSGGTESLGHRARATREVSGRWGGSCKARKMVNEWEGTPTENKRVTGVSCYLSSAQEPSNTLDYCNKHISTDLHT